MSRGHVRQVGDCVVCGVSSSGLQSEVEVLRRRLLDRDVAIVQLETQMAQDRPDHYPHPQVAVLRTQCDHWQDKYDRLLEAHKRLQKVNQGLEDKLLRLVDRTESEKSILTADTASLTTALTTAAQAINRLKTENERYKNDLNLAIQLLQCNPSKYGTHKLHSLPWDLQKKAKTRLTRGEPRDNPRPEMKVIKVPIPTFPPTAMVYSVNKVQEETVKEEPVDAVSAAIMAAVLEERERERAGRHCPTCSCPPNTYARDPRDSRDPRDPTARHQHHDDMNGNGFNQQEDRLKDGSRDVSGDGSRGGETREDKYYDGPRTLEELSRSPGSVGGDSMRGDESKGQMGMEARDVWKGTGREGKNYQRRANFPVNVVDVGTQVLPSYIGETGKVQSTCIYCHSSKTTSTEKLNTSLEKSNLSLHARSKSQPINQVTGRSGQTQIGLGQENNSRPTDPISPASKKTFAFGSHSSWDWAAGTEGGGDESPSTPSTTPSSLVSASLSYESETSNGTSPQDSPLRPPLVSVAKSANPRTSLYTLDTNRQPMDIYRQTDIPKTDDYKHITDSQKEISCTHKHSDGYDQGLVGYKHTDTQKTNPYRQTTETHKQAKDSSRQVDTLKYSTDSSRQSTGTYRQTDSTYKQHSADRNTHNTYYNGRAARDSKTNVSATSGTGSRYQSVPQANITPGDSPENHHKQNHPSNITSHHSNTTNHHHTNYSNSHHTNNTNHHSNSHHHGNQKHHNHHNPSSQVKAIGGTANNSHQSSAYKVAFNARSPNHDVFTPPIHKSPTSSNRSPPSFHHPSSTSVNHSKTCSPSITSSNHVSHHSKNCSHANTSYNHFKSWSSNTSVNPSKGSSPPSSKSLSNSRSWSPEPVVASSTTTASSTETSL